MSIKKQRLTIINIKTKTGTYKLTNQILMQVINGKPVKMHVRALEHE